MIRLLLAILCLALAASPAAAQWLPGMGPDAVFPQSPVTDVGRPFNPISIMADAGALLPQPQGQQGGEKQGLSTVMSIMLLLTVITLAPSILLMTTCFVRIVVVLALLRQAMGTQNLPPPQVTIGLALFMTIMVMAPTGQRVYDEAIAPYKQGQINDYETLWNAEGARIIEVMERVSGIRFDSPPYADTLIGAVVFEGVSNSGYRETPMRLRASYTPDTKKATLVHELGHRLQTGVARRDEDEHEVLFLWLYDAWVELWGKEFADAQVLVERARRGPYPRAWDAALALDPPARAARFAALRDRPR